MATTRTLGVALIGYATMGKIHADNVVHHSFGRARLLYVVGTRLESVAEFVKGYPGVKPSIDVDEVLGDPEVDAVIVSCAKGPHEEIMRKAIANKKHILCEKPLVFHRNSSEKIKSLYEEAERNGVVIIAGFQRRFDRNFKRLKDSLNSSNGSAVGRLEVVRITSRDPSEDEAPFIAQRATSLEAFSHCLYDSLIHDFDMIQWLVGEDFEQIYLTHPHSDTISVQLKFPCGTLCAINWAKSMKYGYDQRVEVFGEHGLLSVENERTSTLVCSNTQGRSTGPLDPFYPSRYERAYQDELHHFIDVCQGRAKPLITKEECIRSARFADKALNFFEKYSVDEQSASTGQETPLAIPFGEMPTLNNALDIVQSHPKLPHSTPLRIVLLGAGRMGSIRAKGIHQNSKTTLVAVVDPILEVAKKLSESHGVPAYATLKEALQNQQFDAVWVSSPTCYHWDVIREAAENKKHIYCEKPIGLTLAEIDKSFEIAHKEGVYLLCGWMKRFDAGYQKVYRTIHSETFGAPFIVSAIIGDHPLPPASLLAGLGSIYHDLMVHDVDTCTYYTKDFPISVHAIGSSFTQEFKDAGVLDGGSLIVTYASGASVIITARRKSCFGYDQRLEVVGRSGNMATLDNSLLSNVVFATKQGSEYDRINYSFTDRYELAFQAEVDHFVNVLLHGESPKTSYKECLEVSLICDAALKSFQTGKAVVFPKDHPFLRK